MERPRIVIAGTNSGAGKTTVTLGLLSAFMKRQMVVQGFKVGPDYIDPSYHTALTKRPSRNLDPWMMGQDAMREVFMRGSKDADLSVIEGVMGMYDGKDPLENTGSTADVSVLLKAPVILVVHVSSMARSAAAVVLGFQKLDPSVHLAGVIVNHVGSKGHYELVKAAIEQVCAVPVVGYLTKQESLQVPERHLGLIPALERGELNGLFDALADAVEKTVDIERILQIAQAAPPLAAVEPILFRGEKRAAATVIAVARDRAFNFYYPENLELLSWYGATLLEFRPLEGEPIPETACGVYIGGGFPEEYAHELSQKDAVRESFQRAVQCGMPLFAECGGFMYLADQLIDRASEPHAMAGILHMEIAMQSRLAALGYREVTACRDTLLLECGEHARGHEFHYSTAVRKSEESWPFAYEATGLRGTQRDGYAHGNLLAGYTHLHFASNPQMVERFIARCAAWKRDAVTEKEQTL
ncbi:cobyrinate a,c-diamide synthase [Ferroacidibacillus organovorans]|uniref:Cobyrinate a,c-diamide synthase n=1 Tax=Ferroacidibacillus organovorans TaxID=1765683 RepID=A0A101XSE2_9BACL|nr:cobyrinate a,c-diamide synthase [Ferroacidibacillus organovorans]KUO96687.1 cobyrinic acid a,c-diamide synthase [Ferroacidibacillus organovorans]